MGEPLALKYRAFISYSHADTPYTNRLHRVLEAFRIDKDLVGRETAMGTIPKSMRPIFRDRDDFSAGHSLTDQTLAALADSAALIVICSPTAARSHYVNEEIRLFKSRHPDRPVIPLIVSGKPGDAELECFPPALKFKLDADRQITEEPVEVLAADAREEGDGKILAVAKVVAGLLGVSSDDIFRRAERERRRKGRIRNGIVAVLAILAVTASGSAVYAWHQLKTNEAFLDATLERFRGLVDSSVSLAQSYAVPLSVTLGILDEAEGMVDVMARYGRDTPKLKYRKAVMLRAFADNYRDLGQTREWQRRIDEARRLLAELVASDPANVEWSFEQGRVNERAGDLLYTKGDLSGALRQYQARHDIISRLVKADPGNSLWQRDLSVSYEKVADVLMAQGNLPEALKAYQDSLRIRARLTEVDPSNTGWQRDLSVAYNYVGDVLMAQGNLPEALKAYHENFAIADRLAESDHRNSLWQRDLSVSYERVADVLVAQGNLPEALKAYQDSLRIRARLTEADPSNAGWQRDLSVAYNHVGDVLMARRNLPEALKAYQDSFVIADRLAVADPGNSDWQRNRSVSYERIGSVLMAQGDLAEALKAYQDSLGIRARLAEADPSNAGWKRDLAVSHYKIGKILTSQGDVVQALDSFQRGRSIIEHLNKRSPKDAELANDLAALDAEIAELEGAEVAEPGTRQPEQAAR